MGTSEDVSWYGGGGIRTHGALADTLVFKTRALNHSTTSPKVRLNCPRKLLYINPVPPVELSYSEHVRY